LPRKTVPPAVWIFATALAVRLLHVWQLRASPFFDVLMGDSRGYDDWARRIAAGEWIGRDVFYQAPLYPYLLGVVYAIAGRHLLLVRVVQAVIGSASCALVGGAAARLFSPAGARAARAIGLAAGLMLALYAPAIFFDALIQKSVLDVFFVSAALWLIATVVDPPASPRLTTTRRWFVLGLTIGALALTRENALVFIVVILAWAFFNPQSPIRSPLAPRAKRALVFLGGLALVLAPVAARNAYVGGGFYITTSQFGPNLYIGNNPRSDGTYQSLRFGRGAPEYERQDATELAERALGRPLTPAEVSSYWVDQAMDFVTSRPGAWLTLMARKTALLWNATEMLDTESQEAHAEWSLPLRALSFVGHFGVLVPLAVLGAFVTWPMRRRLVIVYALTIAYAASVVLFYVFARYRYPLVPMLMLFAAAGVIGARELYAVRSAPATRARAFGAAAAAVAATVFCNWPMLSTTLMRAVTESNLAVALQAEGRIDEATAHYERALALRADYAPAYNNLGTALRAEGRLEEAAAAYRRAIALRGEYPEAHYNLANVLTDEGKAAEAAEHFRIALRSLSGSADVHNNLGIALASEGKRDEAIDEFRAAVAGDPGSPKSHRNLADALAAAGRADEAFIEFRRAVQLAPADGAMHYDFGSFLLEIGRVDEAIAEFRAALTLAPRSVEAHNNLGIALGTTGKMNEAIDEFRAALAIDPNFADAKKNLDTALRASGRR
jgi:Tfp pilus assembly protein PilF/4-amino-4-deoxy-L-arabinose transferase-like glycosyltransferase